MDPSNLPLSGQNAFITGASMGIGAATARKLATLGCNLFLFARSAENLSLMEQELTLSHYDYPKIGVHVHIGDLKSYSDCQSAVSAALRVFNGRIDILINNAGLALGAPAKFWEMDMKLIDRMNDTNVKGTMNITHAVLREAMMPKERGNGNGAIINVSSITGLNAPPFPGEAVYHANKSGLEGFSNSLRNELVGTDVKVLVVRPGCVGNHFHEQRVGYDKGQYDEFFEGYTPLASEDIADTIAAMLQMPKRVSWTAVDCLPTAQRSMYVLDRKWNERHGGNLQGMDGWRA